MDIKFKDNFFLSYFRVGDHIKISYLEEDRNYPYFCVNCAAKTWIQQNIFTVKGSKVLACWKGRGYRGNIKNSFRLIVECFVCNNKANIYFYSSRYPMPKLMTKLDSSLFLKI